MVFGVTCDVERRVVCATSHATRRTQHVLQLNIRISGAGGVGVWAGGADGWGEAAAPGSCRHNQLGRRVEWAGGKEEGGVGWGSGQAGRGLRQLGVSLDLQGAAWWNRRGGDLYVGEIAEEQGFCTHTRWQNQVERLWAVRLNG